MPVPYSPSVTSVMEFAISGTSTFSGTAIPDVWVYVTNGTDHSTNAEGVYTANVRRNFTGTITPYYSGGTFTPTRVIYENVIGDIQNQNFAFAGTNYVTLYHTLAGTVYDYSYGTQGRRVNQELTLAGSTAIFTNGNGIYSITVADGYSGTLAPTQPLAGHVITPTDVTFVNVLSSSTNNFSYGPTHVIGGTVHDFDLNSAYPGLQVSASGVNIDTLTDARGIYQLTVPWNYAGNLAPMIPVAGSIVPVQYTATPSYTNDMFYNFEFSTPSVPIP